MEPSLRGARCAGSLPSAFSRRPAAPLVIRPSNLQAHRPSPSVLDSRRAESAEHDVTRGGHPRCSTTNHSPTSSLSHHPEPGTLCLRLRLFEPLRPCSVLRRPSYPRVPGIRIPARSPSPSVPIDSYRQTVDHCARRLCAVQVRLQLTSRTPMVAWVLGAAMIRTEVPDCRHSRAVPYSKRDQHQPSYKLAPVVSLPRVNTDLIDLSDRRGGGSSALRPQTQDRMDPEA